MNDEDLKKLYEEIKRNLGQSNLIGCMQYQDGIDDVMEIFL